MPDAPARRGGRKVEENSLAVWGGAAAVDQDGGSVGVKL